MNKPSLNKPASAGFFAPIVGHGGGGKGGGGSSRTPREDPDSLHGNAYARIIDLLGEGEIFGPAHGGDGLRDVILNGTRVKGEDGSVNIPGVTVTFRTGTPFQDPLPGFPASENTIGVGVELKATQPWVREFTNTQLSALRVNLAATLVQTKTNGDRVGYRVEYAIDLSTDNGAWETVFTGAFDGKTSSKYPRSHRIDMPRATLGWRLRVRRITPDSTSDLITSATSVDTVVEIIDAKLRYPMSALAGLVVDASQFNAVPTRAYHLRLRIVRVPSNYNPETRTYTGLWNGTFKLAWTNNPAWCFFDLVSNDRYGLGNEVPAGLIDKWALYQIGQYCDEMVPDGFGGMEPRFTCNVYMQQAADAYRVVQDMATCFRGMSYALSGAVVATADIPSNPEDWYTFSNANVINGRFEYGGTSRRSRYTVALVSWTDREDMGRQKVESVEDSEAIGRFGLRETQVTAFGCTSRGQAHRVGKWLLLTSQVETRTLRFSVALERARVMPGKILRIADQNLAGRRIGGRIKEATRTVVTVDAETVVRPGDRLVVNLPSGITQDRVISDVVGRYLTADDTYITMDSTELTADTVGLGAMTLDITVVSPFSETPEPEAQWTLESEALSYQTFRVLSVSHKDGLTAEVIALQHTPSKYSAIDYGTKLDGKPITVIPPSVQAPPANVRLSSYSVIDQGIASYNATIAWDAVPDAIAYEVQWRRDQSDWIPGGRTGAMSIDIRGIYSGAYVARVRAINGMDVSSLWALSGETFLDGQVGAPPVVTFLNTGSQVFGISLAWGFPNVPNIIGKTEIWQSLTPSRADAVKLADFSFPQNNYVLSGLRAGAEFWFWARLVDKNGVVGEFYPQGNGVRGSSSDDATAILEYIKGQISETELAQDLLEPIQLIPQLKIDIEENSTLITQEVEQRVTADEALAEQITTVAADLDGNTAAIQEQLTALVTEDEALAQGIDTLQAGYQDNLALIQQEEAARASADEALATSISTTQAQLGETSAVVQEKAEALAELDGKVTAMYTIKVQVTADGRTVLAGIGVGVENGSGVLEGQVLVFADRFAVMHPNGADFLLPFVIQGGQVFINDAFIGNATITSAKIADLAVTRAKIADAAIGFAQIEDAAVKRAKIGLAEVDFLRIAGQSATVWAQFAHGGMYVDKEQADYQLFGFYTYSVPDWSDALVMINPWQDMGSRNFSYSKAYLYRIKHEQSGKIYEGIESASQPRTFGTNTGECRTFSFPNLPPGDQTFTVFVKPDQSSWMGGIPGQSNPDAQNPENPGQVSNAYSTNARFQMSVLSRMR